MCFMVLALFTQIWVRIHCIKAFIEMTESMRNQRYCARHQHCYIDEDCVGTVKGLAKRVHIRLLELRCLMRWILRLQTYTRHWGCGKKKARCFEWCRVHVINRWMVLIIRLGFVEVVDPNLSIWMYLIFGYEGGFNTNVPSQKNEAQCYHLQHSLDSQGYRH